MRLVRRIHSIAIAAEDGLTYLQDFFDELFARIGINFRSVPALLEYYNAFFESSKAPIRRLLSEGAEFVGDISAFRKVFESRSGITVSTIHGVKGAEYDAVIAYALLEGIVPNFNEPNPQDSAKKLLYVICSRVRKNLHLIAARGRMRGGGWGEYKATAVSCQLSVRV